MDEDSCDHRGATYSLASPGGDWAFSCPDCPPEKTQIGRGSTPEVAYNAFVAMCGAPLRHPSEWGRLPAGPLSPAASTPSL